LNSQQQGILQGILPKSTLLAFFGGNSPAISECFSEIPYAKEQGIFARVTGNYFAITGKNREFAHACYAQ
jgi:hypothetical protein